MEQPIEIVVDGSTLRRPVYECPVHGNIDDAVFEVRVFDEFCHRYCIKCFDEFLQEHVPQVKEIQDEAVSEDKS